MLSSFSVGQVGVGLRKQITSNFVFPTWAGAALDLIIITKHFQLNIYFFYKLCFRTAVILFRPEH